VVFAVPPVDEFVDGVLKLQVSKELAAPQGVELEQLFDALTSCWDAFQTVQDEVRIFAFFFL